MNDTVLWVYLLVGVGIAMGIVFDSMTRRAQLAEVRVRPRTSGYSRRSPGWPADH